MQETIFIFDRNDSVKICQLILCECFNFQKPACWRELKIEEKKIRWGVYEHKTN